ncbi:hypothetical protein BU52_12760 [Streptomyces toyocaensis]|uniref:Uncharacterized protein n=1 Tax=Streptomyces toyocaensis TaxID=55952 RepID=A0A081XSX8_STRTO|nr:hypothetical protein [Streptomyces toyocaensis]KES06651.1 hypothetical protein BU52_12760 [Streptomyces toyocaensis]
MDLQVVQEEVLTPAEPVVPDAPQPLFAQWSEQQLTDLGVAPSLVPVVAALTTEDQLLASSSTRRSSSAKCCWPLYDGKYDDLLEQVTAPVAAPDTVDPEDFSAAVDRPATIVTTTDDALREALEGEDVGRWKVFLHPAQAKLVTRDYSGPARVGGGPGAGKTIVAMCRRADRPAGGPVSTARAEEVNHSRAPAVGRCPHPDNDAVTRPAATPGRLPARTLHPARRLEMSEALRTVCPTLTTSSWHIHESRTGAQPLTPLDATPQCEQSDV